MGLGYIVKYVQKNIERNNVKVKQKEFTQMHVQYVEATMAFFIVGQNRRFVKNVEI